MKLFSPFILSLLLSLTPASHASTTCCCPPDTNARADAAIKQQAEKPLIDWVDPLIGSGGHGHVFVGASVPYGFVQVGPTSLPQEWDWVSGYHQSDSSVIGFAQTHLSGTGVGDLSDVLLMPVIGEVTYARGKADQPDSGLWSLADRSKEIARPGYYSVPLLRHGIRAELTASERVGFHRYTFPSDTKDAAIVLDLENGGTWDYAWKSEIQQLSPTRVGGFRYSSGWAKDQRIFYVIEFSKPFKKFAIIDEEQHYGRADFDAAAGEQILVKVGISSTSLEGAIANLEAEVAHWDFDAVRTAAEEKWNKELGKIQIKAMDDTQRRIFYTALYHTMIAPSLFCDANGDYFGADQMVHKKARHQNYTTLSLWDTYRAAQPLMTLIHPERTPDIINTMLSIYGQQGKLPVWHLMGNETNCMVGNPGICIVADAITKKIPGVDLERAWRAIYATAMLDDRGQDVRREYGYIPHDLFVESVAYDMEYAIADAAASMAASTLGKSAEADFFKKRSESYRHYFDPASGFIRGKDSQGKFLEPLNPFHSTHREDVYCEGNAWQYTWLVPHDVEGLVECFGSKEALIRKLDELFTVSSVIEGSDASPDISGLIGQYAQGNEPSHHIIYLYTMLGQPWKAAERVREVLTTLYTDRPDGIPGNEDAGQMSAWYILSSLGFYQVEPAGGRYYFGSPLVCEAQLRVAGGIFTITAHDNSMENKYIQSIKLNDKPYSKPYIAYEDIVAGGKLEYFMGKSPKK